MPKDKRQVTLVKVLKAGTEIKFDLEEEGEDRIILNHYTVESQHHPSKHFVGAMDILRRHLCIILGYSKAKNLSDVTDEEIMEIKVTGISTKGDGDAEGVTITGMRRLLKKYWVTANSHFCNFTDTETYPLAGDLYSDCNNVKKQALKYVDGENSPHAQQEMFPEETAPKVKKVKEEAKEKEEVNA